MKTQILHCKNCKKFTLKNICSSCNKKTFSTKPAKYSPLDKWGNYRRIAKRNNNI